VQLLVILLVLAGAVLVVAAPLRPGRQREEDLELAARRAALDAAKEAKYREIRDAEMDFRTGKLSDADWRVTDRALRAEAVELLRQLDDVDGRAEPLP